MSAEKIEKYCKSHNNMVYYQTSAKQNINIEIAFEEITKFLLKNRINEENEKDM